MAKPGLDDLWMLPLGDEQRCVSVPQIVEPQRLQACFVDCREPHPVPEVGPAYGSAASSVEEEVLRAGEIVQMSCQRIAYEPRSGYCSC